MFGLSQGLPIRLEGDLRFDQSGSYDKSPQARPLRKNRDLSLTVVEAGSLGSSTSGLWWVTPSWLQRAVFLCPYVAERGLSGVLV